MSETEEKPAPKKAKAQNEPADLMEAPPAEGEVLEGAHAGGGRFVSLGGGKVQRLPD